MWEIQVPSLCQEDLLEKWMAAAAKSHQSCPTLCDPIDSSPPGSLVPGILQARTLEWVAIFLLQGMKVKSESEVARSCQTLRDPMDCSLPASSVHGVFQARVLEWGAIAFSGREWLPPLYSCLQMEELGGLHSPWDHKKLDTTEWLTLSLFTRYKTTMCQWWIEP